MTDDLDALLEGYTGAYLKYPEPRRAIEAKLMTAIVAEIKALKAARVFAGTATDVFTMSDDDDGWTDVSILPVTTAVAKRKPGRPAKEAA